LDGYGIGEAELVDVDQEAPERAGKDEGTKKKAGRRLGEVIVEAEGDLVGRIVSKAQEGAVLQTDQGKGDDAKGRPEKNVDEVDPPTGDLPPFGGRLERRQSSRGGKRKGSHIVKLLLVSQLLSQLKEFDQAGEGEVPAPFSLDQEAPQAVDFQDKRRPSLRRREGRKVFDFDRIGARSDWSKTGFVPAPPGRDRPEEAVRQEDADQAKPEVSRPDSEADVDDRNPGFGADRQAFADDRKGGDFFLAKGWVKFNGLHFQFLLNV
jgi:hypothetical protein